MDRFSHRLANLVVGNALESATLEVTLTGPEIEFVHAAVFAVTGAAFDLTLDGHLVSMNTAVSASKGSRLRFGARRRGARAYLAVAGGFDVPLVFGSRATHVISRMGGLSGRALASGDTLSIGRPTAGSAHRLACGALPMPQGGARVRVCPGPDEEAFGSDAMSVLTRARYQITSASNRMGYRLAGPPLAVAAQADQISEATPAGSLQIPPSGEPILLMADRQTTGGYPRIATVISADLPLAGQLAPGDWIEFEACDRALAIAAFAARERALLAVLARP
jgi:antagonist of KipI